MGLHLFLYLRSAIQQRMKKFQRDMVVADNRMVGPCATLLTLQYPEELPDMVAGQFAELQVPSAKVMLRRPISIHSIDRKNNLIEFLIQIVGNIPLSTRQEISGILKGDLGQKKRVESTLFVRIRGKERT